MLLIFRDHIYRHDEGLFLFREQQFFSQEKNATCFLLRLESPANFFVPCPKFFLTILVIGVTHKFALEDKMYFTKQLRLNVDMKF